MPDKDSESCAAAKRLYETAKGLAGLNATDTNRTAEDKKRDDEKVDKARKKVLDACPEKKVSLPGGVDIFIDPTVVEGDDLAAAIKVLGTLPPKEMEGLKGIYVYGANPDEYGEKLLAGDYDHNTSKIRMFPGGHDKRTIKHEIGHHVWNRLSEEAKERWTRFWEMGGVGSRTTSDGGAMPTSYATTNHREGFAEVYEALRDNEPLDPRAKGKMEEILGLLK